MKAGILRLCGILLSGIVVLLLVACGTTAPTRFYLMSPMPDTGQDASTVEKKGVSLSPNKLSWMSKDSIRI